MAEIVLILGGISSGKSRFAEQLAAERPPVVYLATATANDEEMARRIGEHRHRRPASWQTIECPRGLPEAIEKLAGPASAIVECVSFWLTNLMLGGDGSAALNDSQIAMEVEKLIDAAKKLDGRVILVSSEVGFGLVPPNELGRRFADLLGRTNQRLATVADRVHLCVAGLNVTLKCDELSEPPD